MTPKMATDKELEFEAIAYMRQKADWREERWLRDSGWKHTSSTPGCFWMWEKTIDGRVLLVGQDAAARIQQEADQEADYIANPKKYED